MAPVAQQARGSHDRINVDSLLYIIIEPTSSPRSFTLRSLKRSRTCRREGGEGRGVRGRRENKGEGDGGSPTLKQKR